jgi:hypothetical protein
MPRPVNWQTDFCLPLAGYGSTTITSADPNLNRPALPALCEWVRQGWSGLDSGLGIYAGAVPEARLLDRPVGLDAREFFSSWAPRTPFAGPSDWEWAVGTTPWLGGVFGLDPPPVGNDPGVAAFELLAAEGTYWVRLDDQEVYILVREPDGREAPRLPHPPFSDVHPPRLGFSPIDAAAIGIAWKMMREALANLQPWWTAIVNSGAGTPDVPFGAGVPDVLAGGQSVVSRLVARAQGLAPEYPRIFLWEDPHWNVAAASSQGRSRSIRFRAGVAKGISAPLHRLAATGLTNWALYEYPQLRFPPYPKVSAGVSDPPLPEHPPPTRSPDLRPHPGQRYRWACRGRRRAPQAAAWGATACASWGRCTSAPPTAPSCSPGPAPPPSTGAAGTATATPTATPSCFALTASSACASASTAGCTRRPAAHTPASRPTSCPAVASARSCSPSCSWAP